MPAMRFLFVLSGVGLAAVLSLASCTLKNEANVCSTETKNVLSGCGAVYKMCSGVVNELECAPGSAGFTCTCIVDGKRGKTFDSPDVCSVTPQTVRARAATGCEWKLD